MFVSCCGVVRELLLLLSICCWIVLNIYEVVELMMSWSVYSATSGARGKPMDRVWRCLCTAAGFFCSVSSSDTVPSLLLPWLARVGGRLGWLAAAFGLVTVTRFLAIVFGSSWVCSFFVWRSCYECCMRIRALGLIFYV